MIYVPLLEKHISLVLCVQQPRKHISLAICVPPPEKHLSLVICFPLPGKHMINDSKTEFMLIGTKAQLQKTKSATPTIGESIISPSMEPLRNLGAWFDCHFNLNFNITKTCRSGFFHLHNIRRVRKYLSIKSAEKLVHAFITSRLDYCNSLLY